MATRDVYVGDCDTGSDGGGDIVICHEKTNPAGREITVCVDCKNPPELELEGEDEPSVGDQYSVSGGVAPFSWSFDGGVIDENGKIISITNCGGSDGNGAVGSVTVSDVCGQSKTIIVRLNGGAWVEVSEQLWDEGGYPWPGCGLYYTCETISGGTRQTKYWKDATGCLSDYCANSQESRFLERQILYDKNPCGIAKKGSWQCYACYKITIESWEC